MFNEWTFPAMIAGGIIVALLFGATKLWQKISNNFLAKTDKES